MFYMKELQKSWKTKKKLSQKFLWIKSYESLWFDDDVICVLSPKIHFNLLFSIQISKYKIHNFYRSFAARIHSRPNFLEF